MTEVPEIRTALSQSLASAIRALAPESRGRVLQSLPADKLAGIESASRLGWSPLAVHVELLDRVRALGTTADFRRFHAELTVAYLKHPFMKTLFDTAIRLFGPSPLSVVSWIPAGWRTGFRCAGEVEFEKGATPREAQLRLVGMPASVARGGTMFEALAGTVESFIELTKGRGTVTITESDETIGRAVYRIELQ